MKNTIYNIFILLSLSAFLHSCTKADTTSSTANKAVVESYISPNNIIDVWIQKEAPYSNDTVTTIQPINGLVVNVLVDGKTSTLKNTEQGHYLSDFVAQQGKTYQLQFTYGGRNVSSTTIIPSKPTGFKSSVNTITMQAFTGTGTGGFPTFPDPIHLVWTNSNADYYMVVVQNTEATPELINPYRPPSTNNRRFRNTPNQGNAYDLRPQQFQYFGNHNILLYKINAEYASLYNDNGTNSTNLTPPYTNVTNGLGIFTGVSADTLTLLVRKQ